MNPVHIPDTSARYSRLERIRPQKRANRWRPTVTVLNFKNTSATDPSHKHVHKHGIYGRAIAFILFETTFLVFAFYCLFHPIPLQSNPDDTLSALPSLNITLTEFKAGVMAVSVVWHALACLLIGDIISVVRSAEFMAQYHRLGGLNSRTLDGVSTLTSGTINNIIHFIRGSPTNEFHLALSAMLILTVIGPLGSDTVTVGTIITTTKEPIQVTNLTPEMTFGDLAEQRIPLIMHLEREENSTFKYDMHSSLSSDPVLIPWPHINTSLPEQSALSYQSDILHFRFQCSWIPSSLVELFPQNRRLIVIDNTSYEWDYGYSVAITPSYGMYPLPYIKDIIPIEWVQIEVSALSPTETALTLNTTIAFIHSNGPSTISPDGLVRNMSLSGVPPFVPLTWNNNTVPSWPHSTYPFTYAILRCYPSTSIVPATVTLSQDTLMARRLHEPIVDDLNLIGNIRSSGAYIVTGLLATAINADTSSTDKIFLKVQETDRFPSSDVVIVQQIPLSLDEMSANVNLYMQSAGKALLGGLTRIPGNSSTTLLTFNQTTQITSPVAALVSSKPFLITFTAIIGFVIMLLGALLWTIRHIELRPFNLENLIEILGSK